MEPVLRGVGICSPPFVMCPPNEPNGTAFPGEEVIYLRIMAQFLGYTLSMSIVQNINEMISQVVESKADITLYSLTIDQLVKLNCTKLIYNNFDNYVFLMKGTRTNKYDEGMVLRAFNWTVWLSLSFIALLAWIINFVKTRWLKRTPCKDEGLLITWIMISICMNCYGSLVSISAYRSNEHEIDVQIRSLQELLDSITSGVCRIIHNDEYGEDFVINALEPAIDTSKLNDLKFAFLRKPPILSKTRFKVRQQLESTNSCLIAIDYKAAVPYFRIHRDRSILKIFDFPELPAEPFYYCANALFPRVNELMALAQSNQMWAIADRLKENSAICFVDEGEENVTIDYGKSDRKQEENVASATRITLAQLSDCFELLWIFNIIALVCLMVERFVKSKELLRSN